MEYDTLDKCRIVNLRVIADEKGNLTPIEAQIDLPFPIERIYYLYDVPSGAERGGHAHKNLWQFIIAISGSFDVTLKSASRSQTYNLNRPHYGLLVHPGNWRVIDNFSSNSSCLVLASARYDETDYIRNLDEYILWKNECDK